MLRIGEILREKCSWISTLQSIYAKFAAVPRRLRPARRSNAPARRSPVAQPVEHPSRRRYHVARLPHVEDAIVARDRVDLRAVHLLAQCDHHHTDAVVPQPLGRAYRIGATADVRLPVRHQNHHVVDSLPVAGGLDEQLVARLPQRRRRVRPAAVLRERDRVEHVALRRVAAQVERDVHVVRVRRERDARAVQRERQPVDDLDGERHRYLERRVDAAGEVEQEDDVVLTTTFCGGRKSVSDAAISFAVIIIHQPIHFIYILCFLA